MPTIDIPRFWSFRLPCSCPYGSLLADQSPHAIIATEEQAWADFYYGEKKRMNADRKKGYYVVGVNDFDTARFTAGHEHAECTRGTDATE